MGFDFDKWYQDNKERWNSARRNRYQSDPDYRDRVLKQNQASREKKREELGIDAKAQAQAQKTDPNEAWMEYEDAEGQIWLTIGALARALGKSVKTLRLWETKGWLPPAAQRTGKGERLYTPEQILEIREKLLKEGRVGQSGIQTKTNSYTKIIKVNGENRPTVLFRVSALALASGRSTSIVLQHESKGRFPQTPLRALGGQRLYTAEMIEAAVSAYKWIDDQPAPKPWEKFCSRIQAAWDKLGLNDAVVLDPPKQPTGVN